MISTGSAIAFALLAAIAGLITGWLTAERHNDRETMGQAWGEIDRAATDAYEAVHQAIVHQAITDIRVQRAAAEIGYARQMTLPEAEAAMAATFEAAYGWPYDQARAEPKEYRVGDPYP